MQSRLYSISTVFLACLVLCAAQFADDVQVYEEECLGENKFHCEDGGCIHQGLYCNGKTDCRDGSDEHFCPGVKINAEECKKTHLHPCPDRSKCIPFSWICNNNTECDDFSDEQSCSVVPLPTTDNCKGFTCGDGTCISWLWVCDDTVDCSDKSDEYNDTLCRMTSHQRVESASDCMDQSRLCDGIQDCRDMQDEGSFCANWTTLCSTLNCGSGAVCRLGPEGPRCECGPNTTYSDSSRSCVDKDQCLQPKPICSQKCITQGANYSCDCLTGYVKGSLDHLCVAEGAAEPLIFYSLHTSIRYVKLRSLQEVVAIDGLKHAHGLAFDGAHLYWVESAVGHEAIVRAHLDDVNGTKETLVALGLEDPGDVAVDWLGGLVYFSDSERGHIAACLPDGAMCTVLNATTKHPQHLELNPEAGDMYWSDWTLKPVIMVAKMDGSQSRIFVNGLSRYISGLAIDVPGERLYFVDRLIHVVRLDGIGGPKVVLDHSGTHPFSVTVFENTLYWTDWTRNTLQACDRIRPNKKNIGLIFDATYMLKGTTFFESIHAYHPALQRKVPHACEHHNCSDMCLLSGRGTRTCACAEGRTLADSSTCRPSNARAIPQFLIIGGGDMFTRLRHNTLGNPESRAIELDIGRVQAMAFDNRRQSLYIFDGQRKTINSIDMKNFNQGVTKLLEYRRLSNIVDMDYDYMADILYFADAGRQVIEAISLRAKSRAIVYRFRDGETPISMCVVPDYGRLMVAIMEHEQDNEIHIDSIGMDGRERQQLLRTGFAGPRIRLRYSQEMDNVYISDEGNGLIEYIHPTGTGRENYRVVSTTVSSVAVSGSLVFWADRRTPRVFWSGIHETTSKIRRMKFSIFPNDTQLHLQSTFPRPDTASPLMEHPCLREAPCSHVCVQTARQSPHKVPMQENLGYRCLCPLGMLLRGAVCEHLARCATDQLYCRKDNICVTGGRCDGRSDCTSGEDEEGCDVSTESTELKCSSDQKMCKGRCIDKHLECDTSIGDIPPASANVTCSPEEFQCHNDSVCVHRSQVCDFKPDCLDSSDEEPHSCATDTCQPGEFTCASRTCISKNWRCDNDNDCPDGSDEVDCPNKTCGPDQYRCADGECVAMTRRCDSHQDCADLSDEKDCGEDYPTGLALGESNCGENDYTCQLNRSICLPLSARCNMKVECPGGTDESECQYVCSVSAGLFQCEQEDHCISRRFLCDGTKHCRDGSDEASWNCMTTKAPEASTPSYPATECKHGFRCISGQCIEWIEVCDQTPHCFDGSDENGSCATACDNHTCDATCQPSPNGGVCLCPAGYQIQPHTGKCVDVDECAEDLCSQKCHNVPGSFFCSCFYGYALRFNRRTCKAIKGHLQVLYVSGNSVRAISPDGFVTPIFNNPNIARIDDMAYHVRQKKLYVASKNQGKLFEVNDTEVNVVVTNIGKPSRVALDWITGNVYVVDATPAAKRVRVCNVLRRRCAGLQHLPSDAVVSAFVVDPANHLMFYCVTYALESFVWSASLAGESPKNIATVEICTGLAVDSFKKKLYVAEIGPARIWQMDYDGLTRERMYPADPHLQAPHHLAIFEDHLYFLVANSFKLSRCSLHSPRACEPYLYRVFDADTFALRHDSVQRDDVPDVCAGAAAAGTCALCVPGAAGPRCLCAGAADDEPGCKDEAELAKFNGWTAPELERHASYTLAICISVLGGLLITFALVAWIVYKTRRSDAGPHVRFENVASPAWEGSLTSSLLAQEPRVEIPINAAGDVAPVNPLQYWRRVWTGLGTTIRGRRRPVGTAGLSINVPSPELDTTANQSLLSDTESDLDTKEGEKLLSPQS